MRRHLAFFILITCILFPAICPAAVVDKIEVIVNDEMITRREIDRLLGPIYEQYKTMYEGETLLFKASEARQRIIDQLIEEKLICLEAKKMNIKVDEAEIEDRIQMAMRKVGDRADFEKALASQQLTIKDLRTRYREQALSRRVVEHKVGSKITVTPVEVENYYSEHIEEFTRPEEVQVRNILIRPEESPSRAATLAKEISKRLKEGCDFGGLAKIYSQGPGAEDGGMMGYVKRGDLMPEIEKVVFDLKPGDTSDVIQTVIGYHIFKVEDKRPGNVRSFKEAKRDVEEAVFMEKMNQKVKAWVDTLKKNAYIEIR